MCDQDQTDLLPGSAPGTVTGAGQDGRLRVYARIDLDALLHNLSLIRDSIDPGTGMCCVVKADAYGHGAVEVAKAVTELSYVKYLAVATPEEGKELRDAGIHSPILILSPSFPGSARTVVENDLTPTVFTGDQLLLFSRLAGEYGRKIKVHVPVDTGMSRIGVSPDDEGLSFVKEAYGTPGIILEGLLTHLSRADEAEPVFSSESVDQFREFCCRVAESGIDIPICHCSNSAAVHTISNSNMDMVRTGITMYGLSPSSEVTREDIGLRPVMSLHSGISYIKEIEPGTPVSYGGTFEANEDLRIATVGAGYADGYPRTLSNKGYVLIRGKKARVLGRVCMDQLMVDVTNIPEAEVYDDVLLFGMAEESSVAGGPAGSVPKAAKDGAGDTSGELQGYRGISAEELGRLSKRFNYELVSLVTSRVPRIYVRNGRAFLIKDRFGSRRL